MYKCGLKREFRHNGDYRFAGAVTFYRVAVDGGAELLVQGRGGEAGEGAEITVVPEEAGAIAFPAA